VFWVLLPEVTPLCFQPQIPNFPKFLEREAPEFLKLNPMGRVPVLRLDDIVMVESGAICAYLSEYFAESGMAPAISSPERARYEQWMYFASTTLDTFQTRIMVIEDIPAGEYQKSKEKALQEELHDALAAMDVTLAKSPWLVGNRLSTADLCVGYHFYWLKMWPELDSIANAFPRVNDYLARLQALPSAVKAEVFSFPG
jgi:glutathione S-transferase